MPRPQRPLRERRGAPVDEETWNWLLDESDGAGNFDIFMLDGHGDKPNSSLRTLWGAVGAAVVETYVHLHPGKRPHVWWRLAAPEMRRRLGGQGILQSDLLAQLPTFENGVPSYWLTDDLNWTLLGKKPPAEYIEFDQENPPMFESQATYLKRLRLLLPGESRRLKAADFVPDIIVIVDSGSPTDFDDPTEAVVPMPRATVSPLSRGKRAHV